jgi:hypothetical protein
MGSVVRGLRRAGLAILAGLLMAGLLMATPACAQAKLIGSWRLISATATSAAGERDTHPFGGQPSGLLSYMADGRMTVMIAYDGRALLTGDRVSAPSAERAEAYATFFAYAGRYRVDGDRVTHHVEIASVPNWVGTDRVHVMALHGNRLTLSLVGGHTQSTELVWERAENVR